jgi:hypothetical protein
VASERQAPTPSSALGSGARLLVSRTELPQSHSLVEPSAAVDELLRAFGGSRHPSMAVCEVVPMRAWNEPHVRRDLLPHALARGADGRKSARPMLSVVQCWPAPTSPAIGRSPPSMAVLCASKPAGRALTPVRGRQGEPGRADQCLGAQTSKGDGRSQEASEPSPREGTDSDKRRPTQRVSGASPPAALVCGRVGESRPWAHLRR